MEPNPSDKTYDLLDALLAPRHSHRQAEWDALLTQISRLVETGASAKALELVRQATHPALPTQVLDGLAKVLDRTAPADPPIRIALTGSATLEPLAALLRLFLFARGLRVETFVCPAGATVQELLDERSTLANWRPDVVVIQPDADDLQLRADALAEPGAINAAVDTDLERWQDLWRVATESLGCRVIQCTVARPAVRSLGSLALSRPGSVGSLIDEWNRRMALSKQPGVFVHDTDALACEIGLAAWQDPRYSYLAKWPCSPRCMPDYANSLAATIAATYGRSCKCLVVDLDNVLWGGRIAEVGPQGIEIGPGSGLGEAFADLQRYLLELRGRGVLLAACSANDEATASQAWQRSEMILRRDDFAAFVCNWRNKAENVAEITEDVGIGLDAVAFLDDEPMQRSLVRRNLPEVSVVEVSDRPEQYVRLLDRCRLFESVQVTAEDASRTDYHHAERSRRATREHLPSLEDFLASLRMQASVQPLAADALQRAVQLINRANQFNLTGLKSSESDLTDWLSVDGRTAIGVSLCDRFGPMGLVSVVLLAETEDVLRIDGWVMSCRVLQRTLEQFIANVLLDRAARAGCRRIEGVYRATDRNNLVSDLYARLGFAQAADSDAVRWERSVDADRLATHVSQE